jgi:hypothetical protein
MSWWERKQGSDDAGPPGRLKRALRSIYEPSESDPVPPFATRMINGRIVGIVDARGRFYPEPACCENPIDCEKPDCWTRIGGESRGW